MVRRGAVTGLLGPNGSGKSTASPTTAAGVVDVAVVLGLTLAALALGAATPRRRTP